MLTAKPRRVAILVSHGLSALLTGVAIPAALAQGIPSQAPLPPPTATPAAEGSGGALIVIGTFVVLLAVIVAIAAVHNVRQRREEEALQIQSRLGDALLMDTLLDGAAVVPTVHVPLWKGSALRIEVSGSVPRPEMRERALQIVRQEATRLAQYAQDVEIEDRVSVLPPTTVRQAA